MFNFTQYLYTQNKNAGQTVSVRMYYPYLMCPRRGKDCLFVNTCRLHIDIACIPLFLRRRIDLGVFANTTSVKDIIGERKNDIGQFDGLLKLLAFRAE